MCVDEGVSIATLRGGNDVMVVDIIDVEGKEISDFNIG